jgi:flagellar biosynthesis/type III secretory pathway protein FliH
MKLINLKKMAAVSGLGLAVLVGTSVSANAQTWGRNQRQQQKIEKQQEKLAKQQQKLEDQRRKVALARYRVNRNGTWYNTDQRGADLLRQAVNEGYRQGYLAGQNDRRSRRGSSYYNSNIYRSGNYGYQSYVSSSQYQYYFQQGFQRGYQDGYNSQTRYGVRSGSSINILGSILGQILNIQRY